MPFSIRQFSRCWPRVPPVENRTCLQRGKHVRSTRPIPESAHHLQHLYRNLWRLGYIPARVRAGFPVATSPPTRPPMGRSGRTRMAETVRLIKVDEAGRDSSRHGRGNSQQWIATDPGADQIDRKRHHGPGSLAKGLPVGFGNTKSATAVDLPVAVAAAAGASLLPGVPRRIESVGMQWTQQLILWDVSLFDVVCRLRQFRGRRRLARSPAMGRSLPSARCNARSERIHGPPQYLFPIQALSSRNRLVLQ